MADSEPTLTITHVRATSYRLNGQQRFLVDLRAVTSTGASVQGVNQSPAAGRAHNGSWGFLQEHLPRLHGLQLSLVSIDAAATSIRTIVAEFERQAGEYAARLRSAERRSPLLRLRNLSAKRLIKRASLQTFRQVRSNVVRGLRRRPLHDAILGLELAITDLAAAALGCTARELWALRPAAADVPEEHLDGLDYVATYEQVIGKASLHLSFPAAPGPTYEGRVPNSYDEVAFLRPLGADGAKGSIIEREALMLGLATTRYSKGAFVATDGEKPPLSFRWSRSPRSSAVSLGICTHKEATRLQLQRAGVPVPRGRTFANGDHQAAIEFADRIGYPVVVKPAMGVRGIGVVANIQDVSDLRRAFTQFEDSRFGDTDFIVEQHVAGRDYRIVVIGNEVIAAVLREPASVEGDGERTVAELIIDKNEVRRQNPHLLSRLIQYDDSARHQLERAGMSLASVPGPGQRILLSDSCSLSQGGDSIDVLDELHPSVKQACIRAVNAIPGMWYCGIDFLIEDHTKPIDSQQAAICELNAHAAISNCEYPLYGTPRHVARPFLQQCVEHFGLAASEKPADRLALRLTIRGRVTKVGYRLWLQRQARNFGVGGWIRNIDDRTVEAVCVGDAIPVSALVAAAIRGPRRARPVSVSTEHIAPHDLTDFELRRDKSKEHTDAS